MKHMCEVDTLLKKGKLRCTKDRHELMTLFLDSRTWSASQISQTDPKMDLSTIYRNLQKLCAAKLIRSVHAHTTEEFFELSSNTHHDHETCPNCHLMTCIPCPVSNLKKPHLIEITQSCKVCPS